MTKTPLKKPSQNTTHVQVSLRDWENGAFLQELTEEEQKEIVSEIVKLTGKVDLREEIVTDGSHLTRFLDPRPQTSALPLVFHYIYQVFPSS